MKTAIRISSWLAICLSQTVFGQTNFIYDQQSAIEPTASEHVAIIQTGSPIGQSFTPQFSSVGFVRLNLFDSALGGTGATLVVTLRSNSITGPILGTSDSVSLPDLYNGLPNFFFAAPVAVIPQTTYFFEVTVSSGELWRVGYSTFNYSGGTAFFNGSSGSGIDDLWFREGILSIPEPSSVWLVLLGAGLTSWFRWRNRQLNRPPA